MKIYIKTAGVKIDSKIIQGLEKKYILIEKDNITIEDIIVLLEIKKQGVVSYMLNGNYAKEDTRLKSGDELLFMRMLYGG